MIRSEHTVFLRTKDKSMSAEEFVVSSALVGCFCIDSFLCVLILLIGLLHGVIYEITSFYQPLIFSSSVHCVLTLIAIKVNTKIIILIIYFSTLSPLLYCF